MSRSEEGYVSVVTGRSSHQEFPMVMTTLT